MADPFRIVYRERARTPFVRTPTPPPPHICLLERSEVVRAWQCVTCKAGVERLPRRAIRSKGGRFAVILGAES